MTSDERSAIEEAIANLDQLHDRTHNRPDIDLTTRSYLDRAYRILSDLLGCHYNRNETGT